MGDLLRRTARRNPNKIGLVYNNVSWTYAEFDSICNRLAHGLAGLGVAKGDRVAILAYNSNIFAAVRFAV
ncbi:MAG: AMP-binding protein, partial [Phycisphaerae bacterium]|nr:AMP-binding protein [Phycisphaerae bacterium]NIW96215.1 AMP-binding protein [Phycisphaerae bacterium]NIX32104.1 AMP-binding protein [Phycisphaerae bacterium]